ncbi:hypothetical protein KGF57_002792 [Candida theae]|uniref:Uncharacterized protein n=1 Tax=Candida theae TaxID=1198502 RepID=A0AAD5BF20_9ASCO|nr:uncharacterized protein KGF57_002792 [Candida theae]KAI5957984.1 hypothetical protein KGF57_002792 [Candida theae]
MMLSRRVVTKHLARTTLAKAPQFVLPVCSTISKYCDPVVQSRTSKIFTREYATHVEEYEIDFISLKKKNKRKSDNSNDKLDLDTPLPNFEIKRPENVDFPYHRIHEYNESLMEDLLEWHDWDYKLINDDGISEGLSYTKCYYDELRVFERFLQDTFNYRIKNFADLSGSEIVNTLFIFKDYYTRGEVPEVTDAKKAGYDEMVQYFIEFVNKDAQFPQEIVKDYLPQVKREREISDFLDLGLYFYVPELESLDREFNFKRVRSKKDLILQIDKTVNEFDHFLEENKSANEAFFKVLVQVERYKALRDKLAKSITPLKTIKAIFEKHDFDSAVRASVFEDLEEEFDTEEIEELVSELGVLWSMFEFGNYIPATSRYEVLAPRLYEVSVTPNHRLKDEAKYLLETLTTDQLRSGKLLHSLTDYNFHTSKYKFTGNLEEDWTLNHLLKWGFALENAAFAENGYDWIDFDHEDWTTCEAFYCMDKYLIQRLAETPEILIKYLKLKGDSLTRCLPKDSPIFQQRKALSKTKEQLGVDFSFYADANHLANDMKERLSLPRGSIDNLSQAIEASTKYIGNHLEVLDELVREFKEDAPTDKHAANLQYKQIPDWLRLENHVPEIEFLKNLTGGFGDKTRVISVIDSVTKVILEDNNTFPEINHGSLLTLRAKLKEFSYNNTTDCLEILNTVALNNDVFAHFEKQVKEKSQVLETPYVQIPDELELSNFVTELRKLRDALGGTPFKEHTSDEVLKALDYQIERFFDGEENNSLISSNSDSFRYIRLKRRLGRLFDMNGRNTEALDVLLNSQAVFESFEKEKKEKEAVEETKEYRQMPNDFFLEEYVLELKQLKDSLHIEKFADVYADDILAKITELSKANYSTQDKKLIWHKLYRNLALLFKHNHGATFVLDNVLTSAVELERLNKSVLSKANNPIGDQMRFLQKDEYDVLGAFLTASRLLYKSDVTNVSKNEFNRLVDEYVATLDATSLGYLFKKDILESLKSYNDVVEHYPAFIVCVYGMAKNLAEEVITKQRLSEFYTDLARSVSEEAKAAEKDRLDPMRAVAPLVTEAGNVEEVTSETTPDVEFEYDIREYEPVKTSTETTADLRPRPLSSLDKKKYQDSEQYIADLDNQREIESKDEAFEDAVRAAFASALQEEGVKEIKAEKGDELKPHTRWSRAPKAAVRATSSIDTAKLEEYLSKLKQDELSKQRQEDAYKWSKERYNQSLATSSKKYLLLSLVGDEISVSPNLLQNELSQERDIFEILNQFSDQELALVNDRLQSLQSDNYKVVGYKIDGGRKYLILENEGSRDDGYRRNSGKSSWSKRVTTGAVAGMLAYLALNFVPDEPKGASERQAVGSADRTSTLERSEPIETTVNAPASSTHVPDLSGSEERVEDQKRFDFRNILWSKKRD